MRGGNSLHQTEGGCQVAAVEIAQDGFRVPELFLVGDQLAGCAVRDRAGSSTSARHRCQASLLAAAAATVVDADRQPKK